MNIFAKSSLAIGLLACVGTANASMFSSPVVFTNNLIGSTSASSVQDRFSTALNNFASTLNNILNHGVQITIPSAQGSVSVNANGNIGPFGSWTTPSGITIPVVTGSVSVTSTFTPTYSSSQPVVASVPEASTYAMAGLVLLGMMFAKRRRDF